MISGIYTISNVKNNKIYVGYANDLIRRKHRHFHRLRKKVHENEHLQKSYNKYGEEIMLFEILEECPVEFLVSQEHYWATLLNVHNPNFGYNIRPTHPEGKIFTSKETREKIGKSKRIMISQFTKEGYLIKEWNSIKEAANTLGLNKTSISQCVSKKIYTSGGYLWTKKGKIPIIKVKKQVIIKPKLKNKRSSRSVTMCNRYTNKSIKTFESCWDAHRHMNILIGAKLKGSNIRNAARENTVAYGYIWKYL